MADLADRLEAAELRDDRTFHGYGLDDTRIAELRRWALAWVCDIRARATAGGESRAAGVEPDRDAYLDE